MSFSYTIIPSWESRVSDSDDALMCLQTSRDLDYIWYAVLCECLSLTTAVTETKPYANTSTSWCRHVGELIWMSRFRGVAES